MRDLFSGPAPTPEAARRLIQPRAEREAEARNGRIAHGAACDLIRKLDGIIGVLGGKLARQPENEELFALFSSALDKQRNAEALEERLRP